MENKIGNISSIENKDNIYVKSDNSPFGERFYFSEFFDEKAVKKFVKNTEKLIRGSREYKTYIELLRTNCNALNKDNIQSNITTQDVDLEFHHYPLSLYDIVEAVTYSAYASNKKITTFSVAKEVMDLHYKHYIGLVPLTKTNHELAHLGAIFISSSEVFGDYNAFIAEYKNGMTQETLAKIKEMEKMSEDVEAGKMSTDFKGLF